MKSEWKIRLYENVIAFYESNLAYWMFSGRVVASSVRLNQSDEFIAERAANACRLLVSYNRILSELKPA